VEPILVQTAEGRLVQVLCLPPLVKGLPLESDFGRIPASDDC